jgi:hypothetical protein
LQEDVLLGDLRRDLLTPAALAAQVISMYAPPNNASGVMMLFRNERATVRLWRSSNDSQLVLNDPRYLAFDEGWWGPLRDRDTSFSAVLGRAVAGGRLKLHSAKTHRMTTGALVDDRLYLASSANATASHCKNKAPSRCRQNVAVNTALVACWRRQNGTGSLWAAASAAAPPCLGISSDERTASGRGSTTRSLLHFESLQRTPAFAQLRWPPAALAALHAAKEFIVTRDGVWLPARSGAASLTEGDAQHWMLVSGKAPGVLPRVRVADLAEYLRRLWARNAAISKCPRHLRLARCGELPAHPQPPCVRSCSNGRRVADEECSQQLLALELSLCSAVTSVRRAACQPPG